MKAEERERVRNSVCSFTGTLNKPLYEKRYNNNKTKTQPDQMPKTVFISHSVRQSNYYMGIPTHHTVISLTLCLLVHTFFLALFKKSNDERGKKLTHAHIRTHQHSHAISFFLPIQTHSINPNIRRHYKFSVIITEQIYILYRRVEKKRPIYTECSLFNVKRERANQNF